MFSAGGAVQDSTDLRRILAIPRREYDPATAGRLATALTDALRTPEGTWTLRPVQAIALAEMARLGGLLAPIRVGGGKTLISLLAPRMFADVSRPLILLPAHLREKTRAEGAELRKQWVLPPFVRIESYQTLSRKNAARFLSEYAPDLIVCDEVHYLKNTSAACTRRVSRYLQSVDGRCRFVGMSGTMTKRSIRDFAHLAAWALRDGSPVPHAFETIDEWGRALDVAVADRRLLPGALARLKDHPLDDVRVAFRRRLVQTPGVVATQEGPLPIDLQIRSHLVDAPPGMRAAWRKLRNDWATPDDWDCADAIEVARHARELAVGCYYRWNPRPPDEWIEARSMWAKTARDLIKNNKRNLDTELQIREAVLEGLYPAATDTLAAWLDIQPTFEPHTEHVWLSDHIVKWIQRWASEAPGIVWVTHTALGRRLDEAGIPYYANQGVHAGSGRAIESAAPTRTICASIAANGTGRNLQAWSRNLVVGVPPNGAIWEQLLGRTHRDGQQSDRVTVDVLMGCAEDVHAFWRAVEDADYAEAVTGQAQKLIHADTEDVIDLAAAKTLRGAQWQK